MTRRNLLLSSGSAVAAILAGRAALAGGGAAGETFAVTKSDAEWRQVLSPAQYTVLRQHGTETPGSSPLDAEERRGRYDCAGCGHQLFSSDTKFHSGTGWPSFYKPLDGAVARSVDKSLWMTRTEVHCASCGGHLGHVFEDGPPPTGLRYCMNGVALSFHPASA